MHRCEQLVPHNSACGFILSRTKYKMAITNESEFILQHLSDATGSIGITSSKCDQFVIFALCFYLFRSCELRNDSDPASGSQLTICKNKCGGIDEVYQECINKDKVQIFVANSTNEVLHHLVTLSERFMCSDPNTYIIPQVPVSNRSCDDVSYIDHLLPSV